MRRIFGRNLQLEQRDKGFLHHVFGFRMGKSQRATVEDQFGRFSLIQTFAPRRWSPFTHSPHRHRPGQICINFFLTGSRGRQEGRGLVSDVQPSGELVLVAGLKARSVTARAEDPGTRPKQNFLRPVWAAQSLARLCRTWALGRLTNRPFRPGYQMAGFQPCRTSVNRHAAFRI
jgi:hypothetical protein